MAKAQHTMKNTEYVLTVSDTLELLSPRQLEITEEDSGKVQRRAMQSLRRRDKPKTAGLRAVTKVVTACHWAVTRSRDAQLGSAAVLER